MMNTTTELGNAATACSKVVVDFFEALDLNDPLKAATFFMPEGVWERSGTSLTGAVAIKQALMARPVERTTFHLVSNLQVSVKDKTHAEVQFFLIAYERHSHSVDPISPSAIRQCVDHLEFDGECWRIAHKSSRQHMP
ncbi:nuclear transport factor 2 family protein [Pseudomonas aeruginosa]|jgi:SnoaL-like domain|nr:nuclear transport factor 2 family protein [Pseudomonas aeruginosa]MCS9139120.1 nuclear transport factor 2 family protein [Pseudomonas aeruginosa]MCS9211899.1 nuclear transport factor 2 family protein [Pseudomonas aeruginosa]